MSTGNLKFLLIILSRKEVYSFIFIRRANGNSLRKNKNFFVKRKGRKKRNFITDGLSNLTTVNSFFQSEPNFTAISFFTETDRYMPLLNRYYPMIVKLSCFSHINSIVSGLRSCYSIEHFRNTFVDRVEGKILSPSK